jgi:hypothetical protein
MWTHIPGTNQAHFKCLPGLVRLFGQQGALTAAADTEKNLIRRTGQGILVALARALTKILVASGRALTAAYPGSDSGMES